MSGVFERVEARGLEKGREEGRKEGREEGRNEERLKMVAMIKSLIINCGFTKEQALDKLQVSPDEREILLPQL